MLRSTGSQRVERDRAGEQRCVPSCFRRARLFATPWPVATRLLCPWHSPGESTSVSRHPRLQGVSLTQELSPSLLHLLHWQTGSHTSWAAGEAHPGPGPEPQSKLQRLALAPELQERGECGRQDALSLMHGLCLQTQRAWDQNPDACQPCSRKTQRKAGAVRRSPHTGWLQQHVVILPSSWRLGSEPQVWAGLLPPPRVLTSSPPSASVSRAPLLIRTPVLWHQDQPSDLISPSSPV